MAQAMGQAGLAERDGPAAAGRCARPGPTCAGADASGWTASSRMGFADATGALAELADLDQLDELLGQDYPGASAWTTSTRSCVERALGRAAVDDLAAAAPHRARAARAGLRRARQRRAEAHPARAAPARRRPRCGGCSPSLESRGRGGHDVRDAGAAGEVTGASREWRFGDEQPLDVVRTVRNAVLRSGRHRRPRSRSAARGLRGGRDRAPLVGGHRAAGRHVVLDGAARHVGRGEDHRAGAALAGHDEVPAGRDRDHRVQRLRPGDVARRAGRARLGPRAGHQPAARADAGAPAPGQAPRRRAGHPGHHRRRADRAPGRRRVRRLRLAADAARRSRPRSPRSSGAPGAARRSTCSCSTTTRGWWRSCRRSAGATAAGCSCPSAARSASTSSPTTCARAAAGDVPAELRPLRPVLRRGPSMIAGSGWFADDDLPAGALALTVAPGGEPPVNHSCDPNLGWSSDGLVTIRDVAGRHRTDHRLRPGHRRTGLPAALPLRDLPLPTTHRRRRLAHRTAAAPLRGLVRPGRRGADRRRLTTAAGGER